MEIDFPVDSNGKCINLSSLWYRFAPNFFLDSQTFAEQAEIKVRVNK